MRASRFFSFAGCGLAGLTALVFAGVYIDYASQPAGTWFADLKVTLISAPFIALMRALSGGDYDFAGDMSGRVAAAAAFDVGLAYCVGWSGERLLRALFRRRTA